MRRTRAVGIGEGVSAFGGGIGYICGTPSSWPYAAVPAFILMVLICGLTGLGIWGAWELSGNILETPPENEGTAGQWALTILMALVALLLASLLGMVLAQPLSGFALEKISLAQEEQLTGYRREELGFLTSLLLGLRIAVVTLILGGVVIGGLFVIEIVFPPAAVVTIPLKFIFGGMLLAWDFVDYPLGIRGYDLGERLGWVSQNFGAYMAFGLLWAMLLVIPCIGLFLLPMGVAGATRLVVASEEPI